MAWRCGSKKADGKACRCAVATRGTKCQHHKRKKATKKKTKKKATRKKATKKKATRRSSSGKRVRCRPGRNQQCAAKTQCGTRCKQYAAGRSKFCRVHKGKPLSSPKRKKNPHDPFTQLQDRWSRPRRRNPHDAFGQLQDRWSLPKLPPGTIR